MVHFAGTIRLSKSFEVSTRVMKAMNNMVNLRTVSDTMKELEKEMLKVSCLVIASVCGGDAVVGGGYCNS